MKIFMAEKLRVDIDANGASRGDDRDGVRKHNKADETRDER